MARKLDIKQAKRILKIGLKDRTDENEEWTPVFEGDIPKDEKKAIAEAADLVEMAEEAERAGQDHPAIDEIMAIAKYGAEPDDEEGDDEESGSGDEPWEGYDDLKAGKVVRELPTIETEEELAAVVKYERANKNRDAIIEAAEEIAEEESWSLDAEDEEGGDDSEYKPWKGYDDQTVKKIVGQIKGMRPVSAEFWQNMLDYETENEDRARIKSEIEGKLEEVAEEKGDGVADEPENEGGEEYLSWNDIKDLDFEGLGELIEGYEEEPAEVLGDEEDIDAARVLVAEWAEVEVPEESDEDEEPEDGEDEEGITSDLSWDVLAAMNLDELKGVVKENDLGFRAGPKSDLDKLREKIAEALEIEQPAPVPWRGYDSREAKQIIKKLGKLDDEELKGVWAYESENQDRKSIIKALEKLAEERGLTGDDDEEPEDEGEGSAEDGANGDEPADESEIEEAEEDDDHKSDRRKRRARKAAEAEAEEEEEPEDYTELIQHVTDQVEAEHFAIPRPLPENIAELPFDLTELSPTEVRRLHSANLSYFGRASYVAKLEKQLSLACKHIADEKFADAMVELEKIDPETEKEKSATQLKAEAERDPEVRRWRRRQHRHEDLKDSMRADAEIYKQNLDSLSREWTMRTDEMDHTGGLGPRGKAGKAAKAKRK